MRIGELLNSWRKGAANKLFNPINLGKDGCEVSKPQGSATQMCILFYFMNCSFTWAGIKPEYVVCPLPGEPQRHP